MDDALAARRGSSVADRLIVVVAIALLVLQSFVEPEVATTDGRAFDVLGAGLAVVAAGGAWLARRRPATGALVALAAALVWYGNEYESSLINVPYLVAFYFLGASGDRRRQLGVGALAVTSVVAGIVIGGGEPTATTASAIGWTVAAVLFGEATWSRHALVVASEARAARAEAEREAEAERRVARARLEIARDLHDVLAHSVALMTVQAGVGQDALDRQTGGVGDALATIRATGRDAMREVQALITVLRDADERDGAAPVPTLARVPELALAPRGAGLDVELTIDVGEADVSDLAQLTAYRVVQEAVTNVVRHAHADRVWIAIDVVGGDLRVEIRDDGRGGAPDPVAGFGLRGMRERVESAGGTLRTGGADGGGWTVHARIPRRRAGPP